ncbi:hypothetical protein GS532_17735 [Rhodococcus hoagii]|nr:hypothetical protein [Prescottella equi]
MVSDGKVSFADFADAMQAKVGGAALASGATVRGAAKNMGAALGRLGEAALAPFFGQATTVFGGVTGLIDKMTTRVKVWSEQVGNGLEFVKGILIEGDFKGEVAKALDIDEDAPIVDKLFRVREQIQRAFEGVKLLFTGDFTESFRKAFNVEEDAPIVDKILGIRETLQGWGEQIGRIFGTIKDTLIALGPPVGQIVSSLAQASASIGISVWSVFLDVLEALLPVIKDVLVPAVEKLADLMAANPGVVTAVVGAYTAYRGAVVAATAAVKVQEIWAKRSMITTKAHAIATKASTIATRAWSIAQTVASTASKGAAVGVRALNAAIKANPIMAIVSAITVLIGALVWFFTQTETGKRMGNGVVRNPDRTFRSVGVHPAHLRGDRCRLHLAVREHRPADLHRAEDRSGRCHHRVPTVVAVGQLRDRHDRSSPHGAVDHCRAADLGADEDSPPGARRLLRLGVVVTDQARVGRSRGRHQVGLGERDQASMGCAQDSPAGGRRVLRVGLELTHQACLGRPRSWHLVGVAERDPPRLGRTARCPAGAR